MTPSAPASPQKTALVTGATGGIGKVTAFELARAGYRVLLTARDAAKGERVLGEIRAATGNGALELFVGDLSSMGDVRRIALEVGERHHKLDVLVNNAGGVFEKRLKTVDGFETTFAFNHLAYFLLTNLLLRNLKAAGKARVVNVSSSAQAFGTVRWDDLHFETGYTALAAYGQSKLLNVLFANALARRLHGSGVTSNALHPGRVRSGFGGDLRGVTRLLFNLTILFSITPERGARTGVYLATAPEVEGVTGKYFVNRVPRRANPVTYDEAAQERLWALSEQLVATWLESVDAGEGDTRR